MGWGLGVLFGCIVGFGDLAFECFTECALCGWCQSLKWCQVGEGGVDDVYRHIKGFCDGLDGFEGYGIFTVFDSSQVGALNASA